MTQRTDRINELLRQEIGDIIAREMSDPRIGFATITKVETEPDLGHARVWVSIIGQPDERDETLSALGRAMPFVRHQLGSRIRLRRIPILHLRLDETAEQGTRILRLLAELDEGRTPDADTPISETLPTPMGRPSPDDETPDAKPDPATARARSKDGSRRPAAGGPGPGRDRRSRRDGSPGGRARPASRRGPGPSRGPGSKRGPGPAR